MAKQLKAAILARRAAKAPRKKRTRPKPRQYTIADWERARDRVAAAERRIDNDRTNNPDHASHSIHCGPAQGRMLIKFGDKEYGPYHSQAEAMLFAIDAAQKLGGQGENTEVGLIGEHGRFRPEWSYGKDPYPPQGL